MNERDFLSAYFNDVSPLPAAGYRGNSNDGSPTRGNSNDGSPTRGNSNDGSPTRTEVRSPTSTSTSTEVRSPTSTSTDAYTRGNVTVTGGAGAGATTDVRIYQGLPNDFPERAGRAAGWTQERIVQESAQALIAPRPDGTPIPLQSGATTQRVGLSGLGVSPATLVAKLAAVSGQYDSIKTRMQPLLTIYGPLDTDTLKRILLAVGGAGSVPLIVTASQFVGVLRMGLASAAGSLGRARPIIQGSNLVGHENTAVSLLTAAQNVLDALDNAIAAGEVAEGVVGAGARRIGLSGLARRGRSDIGAFVVDDTAVIALIGAVGLVVAAVLLYAIFAQVQVSNEAWAAADAACARDAAAGRPCTGAQWEAVRTDAASQASANGLVPDLGGLLRSGGSVVFWGGLLAVAGVVGYGIWTTLPAATIARNRLKARAGAMGRYR